MNWFWLAVVPPAMWAMSNHMDKYLLSKYLKVSSIPVLMIFSSFIGLPVIFILLFLSPDVLAIETWKKLLLVANGIFYVLGFLPYYQALNKDDASVVVPIYQTIPVFSYVLGLLFLGEVLTLQQMLASLLIMAGAVGVSLDLSSKKLRIKKDVLFLMLFASLCVALNWLIYKVSALEEDFWSSVFWGDVGMVILGMALLCVPSYKRQFVRLWRENKVAVLGINTINEVVNIIGDMTFRFASLLAPLALVTVTSNGMQPVFVLVYGLILTMFFPAVAKEDISQKSLVQKCFAIILIFAGSYFLNKQI